MDAKNITMTSFRHVSDSVPGFSRKRRGKSFHYFDSQGIRIFDETTLKRIKTLAIPPAYTRVWISPYANSHIQATGRDSRNRKQYRYHSQWREVREESKFKSMIPFGQILPMIRKHVACELEKPLKIDKNQIICAIIYLLDNYFIRIGNAVYEKENKSYGLTTLRKKHLSLEPNQAILEFAGKNSKPWHVVLRDKKIVKLLKKCDAIPGYRLFKYFDDKKNHNEITSQDINTYLHNLTNHSFTAKDFRTWGACRETFYRLSQIQNSDEISPKTLKAAICEVANILGHTPAICQKSYIYPEIIALWKKQQIKVWLDKQPKKLIHDKDQLLLKWLEAHS